MDEIWKPIPDYNGYEVSNLGRVRSYRKRSGDLYDIPHLLKPAISKQGYFGVGLRDSGSSVFKRVHQLVLLAFVGPCPKGQNALHNDDDKSNNALTNLRYGTQSENAQDMIKNNNGVHPARKYTVKRAVRIYVNRDDLIKAYKTSSSVNEVSHKLGLKRDTVMQSASRLRKLGFDLPRLKSGKKPQKIKKLRNLSKEKVLQVMLAWEAGKLTNMEVSVSLSMTETEAYNFKVEAIKAGYKLLLSNL